jgi:hypothetical protein
MPTAIVVTRADPALPSQRPKSLAVKEPIRGSMMRRRYICEKRLKRELIFYGTANFFQIVRKLINKARNNLSEYRQFLNSSI